MIRFSKKEPTEPGEYLVRFNCGDSSEIMNVTIKFVDVEIDEDTGETEQVLEVNFPSYYNFVECRDMEGFRKDFDDEIEWSEKLKIKK